MITKEIVETPLAGLSMTEEGILWVHYRNDVDNLDIAKEHVGMIKEHFFEGEPLLAVSDFREIKKLSREVRNYFSSEEVTQMLKASALLIKPGLSMMIGSFLLRFSNPNHPLKLFSNPDKAIAWLKEQ